VRVLLGPLDPAGVGAALALGLRARGHRADVIRVMANPFGYPADGLITSRRARIGLVLRAPARYDVVHLMGGRPWLGYLDLVLARARGRTCVIQYNGSDVRTLDIAARAAPARARIVDPRRDSFTRRHRRLGGAVAHAALVQDLELALYVRGDFRTVYVLPFAVDLPSIERLREPERPDGAPVRVLHAATDRRIKGSDAIEAAIAAAGKEVPLELTSVGGMPHRRLLAELARTDLLVDQLNAEVPGVLAAEAMALGKPVLCEHDPARLASFARPCPVVAITRATVTDRVIALCRDAELRHELGRSGRRYAETVHSPERAAAAAERAYAHARTGSHGLFEVTAEAVRPLPG
jgi:glycosyltransferase involved in cell wall biosynthesis